MNSKRGKKTLKIYDFLKINIKKFYVRRNKNFAFFWCLRMNFHRFKLNCRHFWCLQEKDFAQKSIQYEL